MNKSQTLELNFYLLIVWWFVDTSYLTKKEIIFFSKCVNVYDIEAAWKKTPRWTGPKVNAIFSSKCVETNFQ